ncbi:MAG: protein-L-isoaspartate(D-aspartate) O-methyltransferase [Anaerolineae bacterium]|jgi:protein-L-isoaspartate(D-aspartate) O-methyltransferase
MTLSRRWRRTAAIAALAALLVAAAIGATRWWGARPPAPTPAAVAGASPYDEARELMVSRQIAARGVDDPAVLAAMRAVPRHEYVPAEYLPQAYEDHPVSIGYGQTISQPYIVGLMTALLQLEPSDSVLEIGTGSGYQAAVLAEITPHVVSVEIVPELCELARTRLAARYGERVKVLCADGYYGWADDAPYDAIIVTCAPDHIPQPLVNQLADGGRMVIPVGPPGMYQVLWLVERQGETITTEQITGVIFVPLVRQAP